MLLALDPVAVRLRARRRIVRRNYFLKVMLIIMVRSKSTNLKRGSTNRHKKYSRQDRDPGWPSHIPAR